MDLESPIATKEEMDKLKKVVNNFYKTKSDCDVSPAGRKVIEGSVRFRLAEMTRKEKKDFGDIPALRQKFVGEITNIGDKSTRAADVQAMTQVVGQEVIKQIPELLKNNFYVRLHAILILGEMNYAPAYELLVQVLHAKDIRVDAAEGQPEAMKVAAAMGLIRILRFANPSVKDRTAIANAIIVALQDPHSYYWLQIRLVEALRYCDISGMDSGDNDRPFVVEALLSVIKDNQRNWDVRTRACYALGRVPLPRSVKVDDVVTAIADCALQTSNAAAAAPNNPHWRYRFWNLYTAFHKSDTPKEKDQDAEKKLSGGLLERSKAAAQPAYDVIHPVVNDVLAGKAPDAGNLQKLNEFVRKRLPEAIPGNGAAQARQ